MDKNSSSVYCNILIYNIFQKYIISVNNGGTSKSSFAPPDDFSNQAQEKIVRGAQNAVGKVAAERQKCYRLAQSPALHGL